MTYCTHTSHADGSYTCRPPVSGEPSTEPFYADECPICGDGFDNHDSISHEKARSRPPASGEPPRLADFLDEARGGPWRPETGYAVWLTNDAGDSLMVNVDDVALLVNAVVNDDEHWHRGPSKSCSICRMAEARATETTFEQRHRQWIKDDEYRAAYIAARDRLTGDTSDT